MLESLDQTVFYWINTGWSSPLLDACLPWLREKWFWAPLYLFVAAFSLMNFGRRGRYILLGLALAAGLSDFTSSSIVKPAVQRIRPCNDPQFLEQVITRVPCGSGYSFTSSHAANHFATAVFLIGVFGGYARWVRPVLIAWAASVALAQVYVGVHYPLDVTAGALLGSLLGWGVFAMGRRWKAF
jgi:undecaprenyl-diphosphatase